MHEKKIEETASQKPPVFFLQYFFFLALFAFFSSSFWIDGCSSRTRVCGGGINVLVQSMSFSGLVSSTMSGSLLPLNSPNFLFFRFGSKSSHVPHPGFSPELFSHVRHVQLLWDCPHGVSAELLTFFFEKSWKRILFASSFSPTDFHGRSGAVPTALPPTPVAAVDAGPEGGEPHRQTVRPLLHTHPGCVASPAPCPLPPAPCHLPPPPSRERRGEPCRVTAKLRTNNTQRYGTPASAPAGVPYRLQGCPHHTWLC